MKNLAMALVGPWSLLILLLLCAQAHGKAFTVLVVMSYEQDNPWCQGIKQGIESVLSPANKIVYFYMDTKKNFSGGAQKAKEAYEVFQKLRPDGVITADDDAQAMFVLPYLKLKPDIPLMFCGINKNAEDYGFPTERISGVLERAHVKESIALAMQLIPSIRRACILVGDSPAGMALQRQVEAEKETYPARVEDIQRIESLRELRALKPVLEAKCDTLYVDSLEGIVDDEQRSLTNRQIFDALAALYAGPVLGANSYHVEEGALCAVVKTGQEQGEGAASALLKALQGTPVSDIPVTTNTRGKLLINVDTMQRMSITPRPIVIQGATLVKTRPR